MGKLTDRERRPKDDCGLGYYNCFYCQRLRYVGNIYRCAVGNEVDWRPVPWGVACKPDDQGVKRVKA